MLVSRLPVIGRVFGANLSRIVDMRIGCFDCLLKQFFLFPLQSFKEIAFVNPRLSRLIAN